MNPRRMQCFISFLITLLFVAGLFSLATAANEKFEEKFEKTINLPADGSISISNISGTIKISGWDKGEVKIEALKVSYASTLPAAQEQAKAVTIDVKSEGKSLTIKTVYPKSGIFGGNKSVDVSVNYTLWIPGTASARVDSISGDISLNDIRGGISTNVTSGKATIAKAGKKIDCESVSGDLILQDIDGDASLKTVSGNISAKSVKGSLRAESTSGSLELRNAADAKSLEAKVLSGSITYEGALNQSGRYAFECFSGNIKMVIPANSGFTVEAETFSGGIDSDFEVKVSGTIEKNQLKGVVGSGEPLLKLKSFSGNISLKRSK